MTSARHVLRFPTRATLVLSLPPVIGFRDRRRSILAGLPMYILGLLLDATQHLSSSRGVELGDVIANCTDASCGTLLGLSICGAIETL